MIPTSHRLPKALLSVAAMAFLASGCGSSSGSTASATAAVQAPAIVAASSSAGQAAAGAVTVTTKTGPLGTYLVDGAGRTLYLWVADTGSTSTCSGQCASAWPPVTGTATAAGSVTATSLSSSARSDGSKQVTYDGHPLYYFVGDKAAGATAGQGSDGFGAKWWLVGVDGKAITAAATSAAPTSATKY